MIYFDESAGGVDLFIMHNDKQPSTIRVQVTNSDTDEVMMWNDFTKREFIEMIVLGMKKERVED